MGITTQDSNATTAALKTALRRTNGHSRMTGPIVRFKIIASGKTPMNVATAIFHLGGGLCGERNHASSPCSGRYTGSPSEIGERRVGKECRSRWSPYH